MSLKHAEYKEVFYIKYKMLYDVGDVYLCNGFFQSNRTVSVLFHRCIWIIVYIDLIFVNTVLSPIWFMHFLVVI